MKEVYRRLQYTGAEEIVDLSASPNRYDDSGDDAIDVSGPSTCTFSPNNDDDNGDDVIDVSGPSTRTLTPTCPFTPHPHLLIEAVSPPLPHPGPMPPTEALRALSAIFGHGAFLPGQWEAIHAIVIERRDVLMLTSTNSGKSLCFQFPSLFRPKTYTIVIVPLLVIMLDQVDKTNALNPDARPPLAIGLSGESTEQELGMATSGRVPLVFTTPEQFTKHHFRFNQARIAAIAVDEAHCIAIWAHTLRPSYLRFLEIRRNFAGVPVIALTATATEQVREVICRTLGLQSPLVVSGSLFRSNLKYCVLEMASDINKQVCDILLAHTNKDGKIGPAIIYVITKKAAEDLRLHLSTSFPSAFPSMIHGGVGLSARQRILGKFIAGTCDIVVATNALSMGVHKPDVRLVVHVGAVMTIEEYLQESGRAGRDGNLAYAVFLTNDSAFSTFLSPFYMDALTSLPQLFDLAMKSLESIRCYASQTNTCRQNFLLRHFGEVRSDGCGVCDVCISSSTNGNPLYNFTTPAHLLIEAAKLTPCGGMKALISRAASLMTEQPLTRPPTTQVLLREILPFLAANGLLERTYHTMPLSNTRRSTTFSHYDPTSSGTEVLEKTLDVHLSVPNSLRIQKWLGVRLVALEPLTEARGPPLQVEVDSRDLSSTTEFTLEFYTSALGLRMESGDNGNNPLPRVTRPPLEQDGSHSIIYAGDVFVAVNGTRLNSSMRAGPLYEHLRAVVSASPRPISVTFERYARRSPCALVNPRNRCFLNAVLQLLAHCPRAVGAFFSKDPQNFFPFPSCAADPEQESINSLSDELRFIIAVLMLDSPSPRLLYDPSQLHSLLSDPYRNNEQHDSSSCLRSILHSLSCATDTQHEWALFAASTFRGSRLVTTVCKSCGSSSEVIEQIMTFDLKVPADVPASVDLTTLIQEQCSSTCEFPEYKCPNCHPRLTVAYQTVVLRDAPVHLVAVVPFFSLDGDKVIENVRFQRKLTIPLWKSEERACYSATSCITHSGMTVSGGHYRNYSKRGDTWFSINDSSVMVMAEEGMLELFAGRPLLKGQQETVYMVSYERESVIDLSGTLLPLPASLTKAIQDDYKKECLRLSHTPPEENGGHPFVGFGLIEIDVDNPGMYSSFDSSKKISDFNLSNQQIEEKKAQAEFDKSNPAPQKKKRAAATDEWPSQSSDLGPFASMTASEECVNNALGGGKAKKAAWRDIKKPGRFVKVRISYCGTHSATGCVCRARERMLRDGTVMVSIGGWAHNSHEDKKPKKTGVPRTIRALLTPTKMNMGRNEFVTYVQGSQAAKNTNYAINASTKAQLVSLMDREKKKSRSTENGDAACFEGSWGTLSSSIERLNRVPEDEHATYSFGEVICDSTAAMKNGPPGRLAVQLSTEHLLLNGYRGLQDGMPLQLCVDSEFSNTTFDGFATMLIGVMDLSQVFHVVAYAVVNHEDTIGHEHVFRETKKEVESVVMKYRGGKI